VHISLVSRAAPPSCA